MLESSLSNFKIIVSHLTPLIAFNINPSLIQQKKEINLAFKNLITNANLRAFAGSGIATPCLYRFNDKSSKV